MLGLAALRSAGSGLESGYSRGRACAILGSDTLSRKNSVSELFPFYRGVQPSDTLDTPFFELMRAREKNKYIDIYREKISLYA